MNTGKPFPIWIIIALVLVSVIAIIAVFILNSNSDGGTTTCQKVGDECDDTNTCCDTGVCTKNVCVATDNCVKINGDCTADSDCCTGSVCSTNKTCQISGPGPGPGTTWLKVTGYNIDGNEQLGPDSIDGGNLQQCQTACDSDTKCLGVVMISSGRGCNMAHTYNPRTDYTNTTSYIKAPTDFPYKLQGTFNGKIGTAIQTGGTLDECDTYCKNNQPCSIYSYDSNDKLCYVQTDLDSLVGNLPTDTYVTSNS